MVLNAPAPALGDSPVSAGGRDKTGRFTHLSIYLPRPIVLPYLPKQWLSETQEASQLPWKWQGCI